VVLNGQYSGWSDVLSGVPQALVLGPLLFVIFINDIDGGIAGKILKFADDTKSFYKVWSANDIDSLRNDLNNLVSWSKEWLMLFNVEKCKVMHICYNSCAEYDMDGNKLETATEKKDLGVKVSDNLKWDKQCSEAVIKANKILGMNMNTFIR